MKTIEINLYKFDELSEPVKQLVINKNSKNLKVRINEKDKFKSTLNYRGSYTVVTDR